jgi:internalin A
MKERREPVTRQGMVACARHFLVWLAYMYVDRVMTMAGGNVVARWPDNFYDEALASWDRKLAEAPAPLRKPEVQRLVVAEAIAESQLRMTEVLERWYPRERVVEMLSGFARAVMIDGFLATKDRTFREWLPGALRLPAPAEGEPTPDEKRLRERVDALGPEGRRTLDTLDLFEATTLRDLSALKELPALRKLTLRDAPLLLDLSPLVAIETLAELNVTVQMLRDFTPLSRMRGLRVLKLDVEEGLDLAPLAALTELEELEITCPRDLAPLGGLRSLKKLSVSARRCSPSLDPIRRLAGLTSLSLYGFGEMTTADVVRDLPRLTSLNLWHGEKLTDIDAVGTLKDLEELRVGSTAVRSLEALRGLTKLRVIAASHCHLDGWPPFRDLPALEEFEAQFAPIACGPAGLEEAVTLRRLKLGFQKSSSFADLGPLEKLTALEELCLADVDAVRDLSPLRGLTRLRNLDVSETAVRDLTPLAGLARLRALDVSDTRVRDIGPITRLTELETLSLSGLPIESVEPLVVLTRLRHLTLDRCERLRSLRPLAGCASLQVLECHDSDNLQGPKTLAELREPPPPPEKRFPSAGPAVHRPGEATVIDVRGHLPKRPPEKWSMPEREAGDGDTYFLEAEGALVMVTLWRRDAGQLLMVQLWPRGGVRMNDKQAARLLRRFRATDPFVETDEMLLEEYTHGRCFIAIPHATSPDSWAAYRERGALLRVEPNADGGPWDLADVRHHLPAPLPAGWSVRPTKRPEDEALLISAPEAEIMVILRAFDAGETVKLSVAIMAPPAQFGARVGDATTRAILAHFRGRGEMVERVSGPFARAPGMRIFVGYPTGAAPH